MRNWLVILLSAWMAVFLSSVLALAQAPSDQSSSESSGGLSHDLSGIWRFQRRPGQGAAAVPSSTVPPLTAWGKEKFAATKPGYGPRAAPGGNDPDLHCDPTGVPRALLAAGLLPFEIVQTPDRVHMFFEWQHMWREIWLNRREHAKNLGPLWLGDSIGWWEGDTFVVDTVGFNDKSWLDNNGDIHSNQMHLIERYQRLDKDTLKLDFTIDDSKAYTQPWVSDTKLFNLSPASKGPIQEVFCASDEEDSFTNRIRMPAVPKPNN
jgi:hypothetical protein